jgi:hypothetical protein
MYPQTPQIPVNFIAVFAAVVASFVFGFLWHGPLFGATWHRLMNYPQDARPSNTSMAKSIVINLVGTFLIAYVLSYFLAVWHPSVWKVEGRADLPFYLYAFNGALFTWLGFFVPMLLNSVAWERKSWRLFGFSAAYHFLNLVIIAMVLSVWP